MCFMVILRAHVFMIPSTDITELLYSNTGEFRILLQGLPHPVTGITPAGRSSVMATGTPLQIITYRPCHIYKQI